MPIYAKGELNPNHSYNSFPIVINNNTRGTVSEYGIDGNMVQAAEQAYSITGTSPLDFQSNGSNATISISGNTTQASSQAYTTSGTSPLYFNADGTDLTALSMDGNMNQASSQPYTVSGTSPISFMNNGTAIDYTVSGSMLQSGTPTPASPITPQECGEKTDNVLDLDAYLKRDNNGYTKSGSTYTIPMQASLFANPWYFSNEDVPISISGTMETLTGANIRIYIVKRDGTVSGSIALGGTGNVKKTENRLGAGIKFDYTSIGTCTVSNLMVNFGSTALPYEPYGYKVPLTIAGNTQNIYIKEPLRKIGDYSDTVNSDGVVTRAIKKISLTGNETINAGTHYTGGYVYAVVLGSDKPTTKNGAYAYSDRYIPLYNNNTENIYVNGQNIIILDSTYDNLTNYKAYLKDQYDAGTPVEIWYVLATEQTDTATVPTITPVSGNNTLSVDTTLAPSNITVTSNYSVFPENPIIPIECGVLSENLFDNNKTTTNENGAERPGVELPVGTYSIYNTSGQAVYYRIGDGGTGAQVNNGNSKANIVANDTLYVWQYPKKDGVMVIKGATAPTEYEPYGKYKIPITVGSTTKNIFINQPLRKIGDYSDSISSNGAVTRNIKKLILTGQETMTYAAVITDTDAWQFPNVTSDYYRTDFVVSHMPVSTSYASTESHGYIGQRLTLCFDKQLGLSTESAIETYLANQYSAGTPVEVWYVLATPDTTETTTIPTISTVSGANTLTTQTDITPSNITISTSSSVYPKNPIYPEECGDKTDNLIQLSDGISKKINNVQFTIENQTITVSGTATGSGGRTTKLTSDFVLSAGTYFLSLSGTSTGIAGYLQRSSDSTIIGGSGNTFTLASDTTVYFGCNVTENTTYSGSFGVMLNSGSTALPYEPYGYKIPITIGSNTNYIYTKEPIRKIGDYADVVNSDGSITRNIVKVEIIGDNEIVGYEIRNNVAIVKKRIVGLINAPSAYKQTFISSHFISAELESNLADGTMFNKSSSYYNQFLCFNPEVITDLQDAKDFLNEQHSAGNTVCLWYVTSTPTTEQTTIPTLTTVNGKNTATIGTTLSPSSITINATSKVYPDNPIIPEMCGERTGNLLDYTTVDDTANVRATATLIPGGISVSGQYYVQFTSVDFVIGRSYTMSWTAKTISGTVTTMWRFRYTDNTYSSMPFSGGSLVAEKEVYSLLLYVNASSTESGVAEFTNIMLNSGSTPLPYEPYGYKITNTIQSGNLFDHTRTDGIIDNSYIKRNSTTIVSDTSYYISYPIPVLPQTSYSWVFAFVAPNHTSPTVGFYDVNGTLLSSADHENTIRAFTFTTPENCSYIRASVYKSQKTKSMLVVGSIPEEYEPYITPVITPIYLGEVETTRRIKKLVLTGEEYWTLYGGNFYSNVVDSDSKWNEICVCSHLTSSVSLSEGIIVDSGSARLKVFASSIASTGVTTVAEWRQYLRDEYQAGHPVIVWYVLSQAQETTGIVNEPLCKIGTYSDKLLSTSTGVQQITLNTNTSNTISFDTKIQPSQFNIRYFEEGYTEKTDIKMKIPTFKDHTYTQYPISISNATNKDCAATIYGNGIQNGTPSPSNIVPFDGCGEKTGNLFDKDYATVYDAYFTVNGVLTVSNTSKTVLIPVSPNTQYTLSVSQKPATARLYESSSSSPAIGDTFSAIERTVSSDVITFTTGGSTKYIGYQGMADTISVWFNSLMLNLGSTTIPYEPYGYKISANVYGCNLFDNSNDAQNGYINNAYIRQNGSISGEQYQWYVSCFIPVVYGQSYAYDPHHSVPTNPSIWYYDHNKNLLSYGGTSSKRILTPPEGAEYVRFSVNKSGYNIMLNIGSTYLPYEPYVTPATTTIYLGEVNTTRRIKKLVLTGTEDVGLYEGRFYIKLPTDAKKESIAVKSTHFYGTTVTPIDNLCCRQMTTGYWGGQLAAIQLRYDAMTSAGLMQNYLQQQYNNGTPVVIWYVLDAESTGIVNEPLYQIGEYSDKLQTNIELKTLEQNTISIDTQVQPSKAVLNYKSADQNDTYDYIKHVLDNQGAFIYKSPVYYDWNTVREIVRAGLAPQYYPIGSVFYDNGDPSTGTAFEVVAYDHHFDPSLTSQGYTHSITLCEKLLTDVYVFDNIEAMLYVETAIPAGTYKFTIPNYDATYGGNKTYYFTSTADVPVDSQITLKWDYNTTPASVSAYVGPNPQTNATSLTGFNALALTEWIDGTSPEATDLGTVAGPNAQAGTSNYGQMNHIHRARYGSNNYLQSGARQYINASTAANTWWQPQTIFDRPYTQRTQNGKLMKLNQDMVSALAKPEIQSRTNQYFETTSLDGTTFTLDTNYTITTDTMFLLSPMEIGFSTTDTTVGTLLDYYTAGTSGDSNNKRIKYRKDNDSAYYWWLRTPYPYTCLDVRRVLHSGASGSNVTAYSHFGVAAACVIQ